MSGLYLVALKAMHAALSSSLRPILTFRHMLRHHQLYDKLRMKEF